MPNENCLTLSHADLPKAWENTKISPGTMDFGSALLLKAEHLIIKIPSVVIREEFNYIINPLHSDIKKVKMETILDFSFDVRLKK